MITTTTYVHIQSMTKTPSVYLNDIAIVTLPHEAEGLVSLPILTSTHVASGDTVRSYGYGQDQTGNLPYEELGFPSGLKSALLSIDQVYSDFNVFSVSYNTFDTITCFGDSGGSVINRNHLGEPGKVGINHTVDHPDAKELSDVTCLSDSVAFATSLQSEAALGFIAEIAPDFRVN